MRLALESRSARALTGALLLAGAAAFNLDPGLLATAARALAAVGTPSPGGPTPPLVSGCPLVEPPVLAPANLAQAGPHTLSVNLQEAEGLLNISGDEVNTITYNPSSTAAASPQCMAGGASVHLPPTLRVNPGDTISLNLTNGLGAQSLDTNLHFHGLHVNPGFNPAGQSLVASDNVFLDLPVNSSQQYKIDVPSNHPIGTYWYHPHLTPEQPQVMDGAAGLVLIGDVNSQLPTALRGVTTHSLILHDMQFDPGTNNASTGFIDQNAPTTRLVNDELDPYLTMAVNETQHWRLANTSSDIYYDVQFDGHVFDVIGQDGNPAWRVDRRPDLLMPPASRFDVLVQSTGSEKVGGSYAIRSLQYNQGDSGTTYPDTVLANVNFTAAKQGSLNALPTTMPGAAPITAAVSGQEQIYFNEGGGFNFAVSTHPEQLPSEVPLPFVVTIPAGQTSVTQQWTVANTDTQNHVFHIHVNPFQVIAMSDPNDPCPNTVKPVNAASLQDTVNLPEAKTTLTAVQCNGDPGPTTTHYGIVEFKTTFKDFWGTYIGDPQGRIMLHCHILGHIDNGMMTWFEVLKTGSATPPAAPTGVTPFAAGSGDVPLSWTAPTDQGTAPITYYAVYAYSNTGQPVIAVTPDNSTNFLVTGLTANAYYTFTVTAYSSAGWGAWANWSSWILVT